MKAEGDGVLGAGRARSRLMDSAANMVTDARNSKVTSFHYWSNLRVLVEKKAHPGHGSEMLVLG